MRGACCVLLALLGGLTAHAQIDARPPPDTTALAAQTDRPDDPRTPRGALLRSLAVPGWGQVYNGQWGKAPIAFGAVAGMTVLVAVLHADYRQWREAYLFVACENASPPCDPAQPTINPNAGFADTWQALGEPPLQLALNNRDVLRRNRDFSILIGVLVYGLQTLDAYVSGHLLDFDVSEDLSLRAVPVRHRTGGWRPGVALRLSF